MTRPFLSLQRVWLARPECVCKRVWSLWWLVCTVTVVLECASNYQIFHIVVWYSHFQTLLKNGKEGLVNGLCRLQNVRNFNNCWTFYIFLVLVPRLVWRPIAREYRHSIGTAVVSMYWLVYKQLPKIVAKLALELFIYDWLPPSFADRVSEKLCVLLQASISCHTSQLFTCWVSIPAASVLHIHR